MAVEASSGSASILLLNEISGLAPEFTEFLKRYECENMREKHIRILLLWGIDVGFCLVCLVRLRLIIHGSIHVKVYVYKGVICNDLSP